jgi:hypothetical protein
MADSARSDPAYPEGGAFGWRGSWNVGRGAIMANATRASEVDAEWSWRRGVNFKISISN